jgi:hypothetical protein
VRLVAVGGGVTTRVSIHSLTPRVKASTRTGAP